MRARMIEVLALQINLRAADFAGQALTVVNRRRTALKLPAYPAQFIDKFRAVADRVVCFGYFFKCGNQLRQADMLADST
jgi:hypothetical protein